MHVLSLVRGIMDRHAQLGSSAQLLAHACRRSPMAERKNKERGLTVPPNETSSTPIDTGSTAKRGRGKLISTLVDRASEAVSV